jgi:hypothetical protein
LEAELAACLAAWQANPRAKYAWFCHHEKLIERIAPWQIGTRYGWQERINYIWLNKPLSEQRARFRNFRPVRVKLPIGFVKYDSYSFQSNYRYREYYQPIKALHDQDWPDNTDRAGRIC